MSNCYVIFTYNNIDKPFISLKVYQKSLSGKDKFVKEEYLELDPKQLKDGLPINHILISDFIKNNNLAKYEFYLVLSCNEIFKVTNTMPDINLKKAKKVVDQDIKDNYPTLSYAYERVSKMYKTDVGYVFYDYMYPSMIVEYFRDILKGLKNEISGYTILPEFLLKANTIKDDEYIYVYSEHDITTLIFNFKGAFTYLTFTHDLTALNDNYYRIAGKHQVELEKKELNKCFSNITLLDFPKVCEKYEVPLDFGFKKKGFSE